MADRLDKKTVIDALREVRDPHLDGDIVSLGYVQNPEVKGDAVRATIVFPTPRFPSRDAIGDACISRLRAAGATDVKLDFRTEVRGYRPPGREDLLKDVKNVVAVASGKGGVGKSTLAVNLATALAGTDVSVGMLDADIYGPSLNIMLGVDGRPEVTSENSMRPVEAHGMKLMSIGFLTTKETPVIWRGPMVHGLVYQFLTQVEWGSLDYLVIDLPPGTGDAQLTLTQAAPLAGAVIVTTPQDVSVVDARRGLRMFEQVKVPVLGIVENMSCFVCPHCGGRTEIFRHGGGRKASDELGVPFLGEIPIDPEVVSSGDDGKPIVAVHPDSAAAVACTGVAERVAASLARLAIHEKDEPASFHIRW